MMTTITTIDLATLTTQQGWTIQGAAAGDGTGYAVSGAGDVNGDGYTDVIIGTDGASPNGRTNAGAAYVLFGKASGFSTIDLASFTSGVDGFIIQGAAAGDFTSYDAVSGAGDVNGDGYDDVVIGAQLASPNSRSGAGVTYVLFGKASGFSTIDLASFTSGVNGFIIQGAIAGDQSGIGVSGAGDVNGDGYADVIIGAPPASPNGRSAAGVTYVLFGKASGFGTTDLASFTSGVDGFIIQGAVAGDRIGYSTSDVGDMNKDGYDDVIIGGFTGAVIYVLFGKASGFSTIDLASFISGDANGFIARGGSGDWTGISVAAGDVNGDGYADVIIGAPQAAPNGRTNAGATYVLFGRANGFSTVDLASVTDGEYGLAIAAYGFVIQGAVIGDYSGRFVGVEDMNGDGYADVIIGAPQIAPNGRTNAGASYVLFGKDSGFNTINLLGFSSGVNGFIAQGAAAGDYSGGVSGVGDINKDGYADVIIGAVSASPNGRQYAGESYILFGGVNTDATTTTATTTTVTTTTPTTTTVMTTSSWGDNPSLNNFIKIGVPIVSVVVAVTSFIYTINKCRQDKMFCFKAAEKIAVVSKVLDPTPSSDSAVVELASLGTQDSVQRESLVVEKIFQNGLYDNLAFLELAIDSALPLDHEHV